MNSQIPPEDASQPTAAEGGQARSPAPPATPASAPQPPGGPPPRPPAAPWPPAYYGPPPRRGSGWLLGCGLATAGCLFAVLLVLAVGVFALVGVLSGGGDAESAKAEIVLIRVEGVITAGSSGYSLLGGQVTGSEEVVRQIERATKDRNAKVILLRVNSPGGSPAGCQEIYDALQAARKHGRKVVVSMADAAASGGYYVSAPADKIYANPATITGSIGVIMTHEDMSGLLDKVGVKPETVKSGELKDMFSAFGPLSDDARAVVTTQIMQIYDQFVEAVAEGRAMSVAEVRALADGRTYTGQQAVANGLVDELGGLQEALKGAAKLSGAKSPAYKEYGLPSLLRLLVGGGGGDSAHGGRVVQAAPPKGLLYDESAARLVWGEARSE